jgi:hypothetical protein
MPRSLQYSKACGLGLLTAVLILTYFFDDDDDVCLLKISTWQWVTKSISILIWNQPEGHKYKTESIRKIYS